MNRNPKQTKIYYDQHSYLLTFHSCTPSGTPTPINSTSVQPLERRLTQFQLRIKMLLLHPTSHENLQGFSLRLLRHLLPASCHHFDYYNSPDNQSGSSVLPTQDFQRYQATFTI
ncbi:hypothetical protein TNCV_3167571 [Trichonephila clavipes]|uniref:Uncharacterized protein n=1 Tax=Trichonephila clavipes TaxID=2585209 RepID=A0A8X6R9I5_TRICX|nr:hypothetical protein TNCV_3167571 [Trichonephila clavipes]